MHALKRTIIIASLLVDVPAFAQIKVVCIGNSITYGYKISDRLVNSYPAQLGKILGKEWVVENFGVNGATLLQQGDLPYWIQPEFKAAKNLNPDIVIIKLGTNDTKPQNWKYKQNFIRDYTALINEFKNLPSKPVIFICLPVPAYKKRSEIRDSIITAELIPMIREIARQNNVALIDLNTPLQNHPEWFPDKIHPNALGAKKMAEVIAEHLLRYRR